MDPIHIDPQSWQLSIESLVCGHSHLVVTDQSHGNLLQNTEKKEDVVDTFPEFFSGVYFLIF